MLEISGIGISFLSPCVLPLVPGPGQLSIRRLPSLVLSGSFVLGFSSVFVALGASATLLSRILLAYRYETNLLVGAIIILFGVFATGLVPMPWLQRDIRYHGNLPGGKPLGSYFLGLAFGFGWTPCIGPVLGAILTVSSCLPRL